VTSVTFQFVLRSIDSQNRGTLSQLPDSGLCVVKKWRFGRPVPSVEITFTLPNPVGDGTKWRVDTSVLSLRHTNQASLTAVWFVFYDTGSPTNLRNFVETGSHFRT